MQARAYAIVEIVKVEIGGDHERQLVCVAVIDDLKEFLGGPGGRVLGAQIVQHEQFDVSDFVKALIERCVGCRIRCPQPIQQIGNGEEDGCHTVFNAGVGDGGAQMGLPAAVGAHQDEPPLRRGGELLRLAQSVLKRANLLVAQPQPALH